MRQGIYYSEPNYHAYFEPNHLNADYRYEHGQQYYYPHVHYNQNPKPIPNEQNRKEERDLMEECQGGMRAIKLAED